MFLHDPRVFYKLPELKNKRAMVLAPHPDDETIGCGGIIFNLVQGNVSIRVILATDGSEDSRDESISAARLKEFKEAMAVLNVTDTICLGYRDGYLEQEYDGFKARLAELAGKSKPDVIFSPYIFDRHKDHRAVAYALADCLDYTENTMVAMYEIWTPILYPNCYIDITRSMEKKLAAVSCYKSQEIKYGITGKTVSLNTLRASLSMRRNIGYAEAFKCFSAPDYIVVTERLKELLV